jgi:sRNA-binding protein
MSSTQTNIPDGTKCKARRDPAIGAVLELLVEMFPKCFALFEQHRRPLKINIHSDILALLDGAVTGQELYRALSIYTGNRVYRRRLIAGAVRIDLNGQPAGVVTPEQAQPRRKVTVPAAHAAAPRRLTLADLREAAKRRREQTASAPNPPVEAVPAAHLRTAKP